MGDSPRSNQNLNGKVRLTNNRERILELHKRLHNKQIHDAVLDNDFEAEQKSHNITSSARVRRADLKRYLGDPLPLPYLTSPRDVDSKTQIKSSNPPPRHTILKLTKPLGKNTDIQAGGDVCKDKLRQSLKNFQRSSSKKKLVDRVVQTDDILYEPLTPKSFRFPISSVDTSPRSFNSPFKSFKLESSFEKDLLLNGFKIRNSSLTPDNKPKPLLKLEPPLEVKSEVQAVTPAHESEQNKDNEIRLNCRSILGSPILLLILIIILFLYTRNMTL